MGKKKAALEIYHHAAEKFARQGSIAEATAMAKMIMRADPRQIEIRDTVPKMYARGWFSRRRRKKIGNEPATDHATG